MHIEASSVILQNKVIWAHEQQEIISLAYALWREYIYKSSLYNDCLKFWLLCLTGMVDRRAFQFEVEGYSCVREMFLFFFVPFLVLDSFTWINLFLHENYVIVCVLCVWCVCVRECECMCVCVCARACVCVCERERERERGSIFCVWLLSSATMLVNWCFEPSQPLGIISGLKETFIERHSWKD